MFLGRGAATIRRAAINGYRTTLGYIMLLREQGVSYYENIAKKFNIEGHRTRQGKNFTAMTVYSIVQRNAG